jgi:Ca-activated chloride channel homolog
MEDTSGQKGVEKESKKHGVRMENEELKEILSRLSIPEHGHESKNKTITSALTEFRHHAREREERSKGFLLYNRLIGKKPRGGFFMNRSIAVAAGTLAIFVIAFAVVFSPQMISQRTHIGAPEKGYGTDQAYSIKQSESGKAVQQNQKQPPAEEKAEPQKPEVAKYIPPVQDKSMLTPITGIPEEKIVTAEPRIMAETKKEMTPAVTPEEITETLKGHMGYEASAAGQHAIADADEVQSSAGLAKTMALSPGEGSLTAMTAPEPEEFTLYEIPVTAVKRDARMINPEYVGRDKFEDIKPNTVKLVSEEPVSTFSIDVDTASYAFVRRALNNGYLPQSDSVRIEEMINYFDYDYPLPKDKSEPFKPTVAIFPTPWNANSKLLHIGIKGYDIIPDKKPRANLVFLIDVSGSMQSEDKLPLLKNSLRMLVETLGSDDTVAIVTYAGSAATELEKTRASEKAKILAAIDRLQAGGSTAGAEGIRTAYSIAESGMDTRAVNRVILATDGDFNVGITDSDVLQDFVARKRISGIYLSVLGFGQGNYRDELMQKLAQNGNGNAAYIDNLNEARKVLVDEVSGTLFTIAKDVKIQVEFNPAMISEYRLIGYETRQLNREDFRNDKVDAGDIGSGHSVTAIYEITPKGSNAQLIDDLRYASKEDPNGIKTAGKESEYAFLKIRYKLPEEEKSREISKSIDKGNEYKKVADAPDDSRFAAAVAAFGQLLRGDSYINRFTYDDVINLAKGAIKDDSFGYRTEFLNLVRLAGTASPMGDR